MHFAPSRLPWQQKFLMQSHLMRNDPDQGVSPERDPDRSRGRNPDQERRAAQVEALATIYKRWISPPFHALAGILLPAQAGCRYLPTCSEYGAVAVARYGWGRGTAMAIARIARCHPWSKRGRIGGFDPVP